MTTKKKLKPPKTKGFSLAKEFAASKKVANPLLKDIQAYLLKRALADDSRPTDVLHPSEMASDDFCPRKATYQLRGIRPSDPESVNAVRENIYQEGHDIHHKYQNYLDEMGVLWGNWRCKVCLTGYDHCMRPNICDVCDTWDRFEYKEISLESTRLGLAGHADGAVPYLNALIEIKSVGIGTVRFDSPSILADNTHQTVDGKSVVDYQGVWNSIRRPFIQHRKQGALYLFLAKEMGLPFDKIIYIYESKMTQQTKAFTVKLDMNLIDPILLTASQVVETARNGDTFRRPEGYRVDRRPCTQCPFRTHCYEDEDEVRTGTEDGRGDRGARGDLPEQASRTRTATTGRPDSAGRHRTDASVRPSDEVGGVSQRGTGKGRGRREVRRRPGGPRTGS